MTETLIALGDHAAASASALQLAEAAVQPANDVYQAAGFLARCVPLADQDRQLPDAERQEVSRSYADRAVATLRQAVQHGFKDVALLKTDEAWQPLRQRPDFQKLLTGLEGRPSRLRRGCDGHDVFGAGH